MTGRAADDTKQDPGRADQAVGEVIEEPTRADPEVETPQDASVEEDGVTERLQAAEALAEERHSQFLRLSADFENFRRRVERDRDDLRASVARELLTSLLPAYDNLERALKALPDNVDAGLAKGLEMTRKSFLDGLSAQGVERVPTTGALFDPAIHEAIQSVPDASPEGTVLDEYQAGFQWRDRVLRAALVKVSSGAADSDS